MATALIQHLDLGLGGTQTVVLDLGRSTRFIAWGAITKVDPIHAVNGNDWAALDIPAVDGLPTAVVEALPGGVDARHVGAVDNTGRSVTVRLRSNVFPDGQNLSCAAEFVVLFDL